MKKIRRILVVMDLPKQRQTALAHGVDVARRYGAEIHLVSFAYHEMVEQKDVFDAAQRKEVRTSLVAERQAWLADRSRDAARGHDDLVISSEVVWEKDIHDWIIDACAKGEFGLVVKTAHRSRTLVHMPTDWHLLRACKAPVLLATQGKGTPKPRILATVDPTRKDKAHTTLNRKVVQAAVDYAATHDAEVHLGWCVATPEALADLDMIDPKKYVAQMVEKMQPRLDELAKEFDIPAERVHTTRGKTRLSITGMAMELKAELLVLGTTARTGVRGLVVGNTAEKVLAEARCDLLAIKP